jgi:hypothetical protein
METTLETGNTVSVFTEWNSSGDVIRVIGRALQAAASVASDDKARPMLAAVRVRVAGDRMVIESTDSYRLLSVAVDITGSGDWSAVIDAKQAGKIGATLCKVRGNEPVTFRYGVHSLNVATGDWANTVSVVDGDGSRFPDLDSLIAHNETNQTGAERWPDADRDTVSMNPELLAETLLAVHKVLAGKRSDSTAVKVHNVSAKYAWRVTGIGENVTVTGMVMPLRG